MRPSLRRYTLCGAVCSVVGPGLFWLLFPIGTILAVSIADIAVHSLRFTLFKYYVYRSDPHYAINKRRYICAILPVSALTMGVAKISAAYFDRTAVTILSTLTAILAGYVWNTVVFRSRRGGCNGLDMSQG